MSNKLCLGTVQFGMKYGIKNEIGRKPSKKECFSILEEAIASGIQYIDTAYAYGKAEELLGQFQIAQNDVYIISKLRPNILECVQYSIEQSIVNEVRGSLNRMNLKLIDGFLLHSENHIFEKKIICGLQLAKEQGYVKNIGVSVYTPQKAFYAVQSGIFDYVQIPYNVLDQRLDQAGFFELAKKQQVTVFARSAFLQGLLLMDINKIPPKLQKAVPYINDFSNIARSFGFSRYEAALLFSYCHEGIDKVVFGVDTVEQLKLNLNVIKKKTLFTSCFRTLKGYFKDIDKSILDPSLWN